MYFLTKSLLHARRPVDLVLHLQRGLLDIGRTPGLSSENLNLILFLVYSHACVTQEVFFCCPSEFGCQPSPWP